MERWPVRYRLAAALVVPLLALAGLAALLVSQQVDAARAATRSQTAAQLTIKVNSVVRALAQERYATLSFIGSRYNALEAETAASRPVVDKAFAELQAVAAGLPDDPRLNDAVVAAEQQMTQTLPEIRKQVDERGLQPGGATDQFNGIVRSWLSVVAAQSGVGTSDREVVRTVAALTAISNVTEQTAQQYGSVSVLLILKQIIPENFGAIRSADGAEAAWFSQFQVAATDDQRALYDQVAGPTLGLVDELMNRALTQAQTGAPVDVTADQWAPAVRAKIDKLHAVEDRITEDLATTSSDLASAASTRAWLAGVLAVVVMALTVAVSVVIARRLARQLRALREDALEIAEQRLPAVTAAIQDRRAVEDDLGVGDGLQQADEIGDVAQALRDVYAAAVQSATEVAAQHSVSASMRNLARRSQTLIHRQLKLITDLERDQQDPDMLERLFRLDHLATRMRREVEGQIALSGGRPSRVFRAPVKVIDTMRAAAAEVESYTRVETSTSVEDRLVGPVVGDVIHLLAELIENACQMSPDNTPVSVTASRVGTGVAVEVEDRGIGISAPTMAELNARLADPPPFNPQAEGDKLGLWVVANLAARHGITVQLARNPYGGVTAIALLPSEVLADIEIAGPVGVVGGDDPIRAALARISPVDRLDMVGAGYDEPSAPAVAPLSLVTDNGLSVRQPGALTGDVESVRASFFSRPSGQWSTSDERDSGSGRTRPGPSGPTEAGQPVFDAMAADWAFDPTPPPAPPPTIPMPAPAPAAPAASASPPVPAFPPAAPISASPPVPASPPALPVPPAPPARSMPAEPPLGHLPNRRRGENLSAELRGGRRAPAPGGAGSGPDPEKARRLVTSFRAGFQQGLPSANDHERISDATHW
ncbi:sensor histidine kinase [Frankia nepalensis]|uniref:sensor histidine kinase n=1 Tax=Frankia nepalensis TaxID=1836974 RepID=UPI001933E305|nr:sensor histidine kinase [Frankia nepalensis]MBL7510194.1 sensor histidine kinase [Frankia nepalensis]